MYTQRPAEFAYERPSSLEETLEFLAKNEDARPLAGGHSLLPMMKLRLATPPTIVDLGALSDLDGIDRENGGVRIGALTTHSAVAASEVVRSACPLLAETAAGIGDRQVRNRGTIGGSLAHADPGADYPTVLSALEATVRARGKGGEREIAAADFSTGLFATALRPAELVVSIGVPALSAGTGAHYEKHRHPASSFAVVGVAAVVRVEGGACAEARIVIGGAVPSPVRAETAAQALVGETLSTEAIARAADRVADALADPIGDVYASAEYRVHLAKVMTRRALTAAAASTAG
jgi:aerobic carbon-monoxide dehydrogenase medium subunit